MPKISIIIPCFNQGIYLNEAVESVLNQSFDDFEIIIVNDGSTDDFTNKLLATYEKPKTKVIITKNNGVSMARNIGISNATGEYILPLDADDKIGTTYLEEAVKVLDQRKDIGIVYCDAEFFGNNNQKWKLAEYSLNEILISNCIFCSGVFRKEDWLKVNGYKAQMEEGWEDWEFWLSLIENGAGVYKIPKVLFYYRQHENHKTQQSKENRLLLYKKIIQYHSNLYIENLEYIILPLSYQIAKLIPKDKLKQNKKYRLNLLIKKIEAFIKKLLKAIN